MINPEVAPAAGLSALRRTIADIFGEDGERWFRDLPSLLEWCRDAWGLTVDPPFADLSYHYVAPAATADGRRVVLKLGVPSDDFRAQVQALAAFAGGAMVQLLAADPRRGAMLMERLDPGAPVTAAGSDDDALEASLALLPDLWRPVPLGSAFPTVADWAAGLARLRARFGGGTGPLPGPLVEAAERRFADLLAPGPAPYLLHGDYHYGNVLSARRRPWVAIDPKGVVGEPAYDVGYLIANPTPSLGWAEDPRRILERRLAIAAERLGLDARRLHGYAFCQSVLGAWWSVEDHDAGWEPAVRVAEALVGLGP